MSVIDDYLATLDNPQKTELTRIRSFVMRLVPDAQDVLTYGMPGFKNRGKYLISFAGFKDHLSVFPGSGPIEELKDELKAYTTSKGTIQFTLDHPLSDELLTKIIAACVVHNTPKDA